VKPRLIPILAGLLLLPVLALGDERAEIFSRFDHGRHEKALAKANVSCVSCHQVGATTPTGWSRERLNEAFLVAPDAACHQCHAPGVGGLGVGEGQRAATGRCASCHEDIEPPVSHDAGWLALHGADARDRQSSCSDCHARSYCVECHDRRETATNGYHDASWLTVHGIASRAAPASCDSCHVQNECVDCHSSPAGFGRTP